MFTGIITDLGHVRRVLRGELLDLTIATAFDLSAIPLGASIACSGACLTVVAVEPGAFTVQASVETLTRTTLGAWEEGTPINLERPVRLGDELGGHLVLGHVDGLAQVVERRSEAESERFVFESHPGLAQFIAPKGSVALDGVSLTVNEVSQNRFGVNIIPHTLSCTIFGQAQPGQQMNLEIDLIARYVARLPRQTQWLTHLTCFSSRRLITPTSPPNCGVAPRWRSPQRAPATKASRSPERSRFLRPSLRWREPASVLTALSRSAA